MSVAARLLWGFPVSATSSLVIFLLDRDQRVDQNTNHCGGYHKDDRSFRESFLPGFAAS
jgi:hypothetical protein